VELKIDVKREYHMEHVELEDGTKIYVDGSNRPAQWDTDKAYHKDDKFDSAGGRSVVRHHKTGLATHIKTESGEEELDRDSHGRITGIGGKRITRGELNLD
jgi:hypothetical protein